MPPFFMADRKKIAFFKDMWYNLPHQLSCKISLLLPSKKATMLNQICPILPGQPIIQGSRTLRLALLLNLAHKPPLPAALWRRR
jgi:hypothetical protein